MNGAITEPWVRMTRTPNSAIINRSGSSQNFFRSKRKPRKSLMNDIAASEWLLERVEVRRFLGPLDPITFRSAGSPPHRIGSERAHHQARRNYPNDEYGAEEQRVRDLMKQDAKVAPSSIDRPEDDRHDQAGQRGHRAQYQEEGVEAEELAVKIGARAAQQQKNAADDEPETSVARALDLVLAAKFLMHADALPRADGI